VALKSFASVTDSSFGRVGCRWSRGDINRTRSRACDGFTVVEVVVAITVLVVALAGAAALFGNGIIVSACIGTACYGDVKLSGTLNGQLTIASEDDIIIVGNVQYHVYPGGNDVLGLVADNDVAVYHPLTGGGANAAGSLTDPIIDAAILSLNHSFYVQNWSQGAPLGTLQINGLITQEFRGPVGTFSGSPPVIVSGYNKNYNYDTRLKYLSPPYFLSPTQSAWGRISYAELTPNPTP